MIKNTDLTLSKLPGKHERHLIRRANSPLFGKRHQPLHQKSLEHAQRKDHEELIKFINHLRGLVSQAMNLSSNVESDVIIKLKEKLDESYEEAARLADQQDDNKAAILALIESIMSTISKNAAGDTLAFQELGKERQARGTHFALLENPLIADIIDPNSAIADDELIPTLFSVSPEVLEKTLVLFDLAQLMEIQKDANILLEKLNLKADYQAHLDILNQAVTDLEQMIA